MLKDNHEQLEGKDKFEGFLIDLLSETLSKERLSITWDAYMVSSFGMPDEEGNWGGLMKEVIDGVICLYFYFYFTICIICDLVRACFKSILRFFVG